MAVNSPVQMAALAAATGTNNNPVPQQIGSELADANNTPARKPKRRKAPSKTASERLYSK